MKSIDMRKKKTESTEIGADFENNGSIRQDIFDIVNVPMKFERCHCIQIHSNNKF